MMKREKFSVLFPKLKTTEVLIRVNSCLMLKVDMHKKHFIFCVFWVIKQTKDTSTGQQCVFLVHFVCEKVLRSFSEVKLKQQNAFYR